jgi:hypothetical protein
MDFENLLNFERASVATYYDADGVLQTAAIDEPRLDHDPVALEPLGLLVEEGRTNLVKLSENINGAGWVNNAGLAVIAASDPDQKLNGLDIFNIETSSGGGGVFYSTGLGVLKNEIFTYSFLVKKISGLGSIRIGIGGTGFTVVPYAVYDIDSETLITEVGDIISHSISDIGGGWKKVSITAKVDSDSANITTTCYSGQTGINSFNVTAHQFERGGFATSYIPTTGAQVTRSPDICNVKSVNPWIDQNEGTLYAHLNKKAGSYVGNYLTLSDGTASNQIVIKDRSVFYKETNYIPSPFDPVSWSAADPDGTKSNITLSNPSGSSIVGDMNITSGNYTFITTTSSFNASIGEKIYLCFIVKNISADNVFIRFQSDSGSEDQTQVSLTTLTKVAGGSDILVASLSDGFSLLQVERVASANLINADIHVYANGDGGQFYVQAAFFGKADDWPAIISDANVIQAGANNLTGTQSFAAPLENGESKLALSYNGSTYSAAKDGVAFSGVNAGVPALTDLYIGSGEDGSARYFNGHIIDAQYFPRKLDESELVDLTT